MSPWRHIKDFAGGPFAVVGGAFGFVTVFLPLLGLEVGYLTHALGMIALALAYYATYRKNKELGDRLREELKFSCGPAVDGSVHEIPPTRSFLYSKEGMRWLRLVVETRYEAPVQNCTGYLVGITRDGRSLFTRNNQRLTFQPGSPDQPPRTVVPNSPEFLDVVMVADGGHVHFGTPGLQWEHEPTEEIFTTPGVYTLHVVIKSESRSYPVKLAFSWNGDPKAAELTMDSQPAA